MLRSNTYFLGLNLQLHGYNNIFCPPQKISPCLIFYCLTLNYMPYEVLNLYQDVKE